MPFNLYSINTGFYINSSGYVGVSNSNPQHALDVSGNFRSEKIFTISSNLENGQNGQITLTVSPENVGTIIDTNITSCNDMVGKIALKVGANDVSKYIKIQLNFRKPYDTQPFVIISYNNANARTSNIDKFYLFTSKSGFYLEKEEPYSLAETPTAYIWDYIVIGR